MIMKRLLITIAAMAALAPAARAAGKADAGAGCDGVSTPEIVNCVMAKTAQWDKRMNAAYQKALKDGEPPRQEPLRTAQRLGSVPRRQLPLFRHGRGYHCAHRCGRVHAEHDRDPRPRAGRVRTTLKA